MGASRWPVGACAVLAAALLIALPCAPARAAENVAVATAEGGALPLPGGGTVEMGRRYAPSPAATIDVYRPPPLAPGGSGKRPAVLVVHGGAWWGGSRSAVAPIAAALARAGFVAFNADYPLSRPWLPSFPGALRTLRGAVRWIRAEAADYDVDPQRIGVLGTSAGGHLAALLATDPRRGAQVRAAVLWSAPLDLVRLAPTGLRAPIRQLLGCGLQACPQLWRAASPIAHVDGDEAALMIVNSRQEVVPMAQAEAMTARLAGSGAPRRLLLLPGTRHARVYADVALAPSVEFLRRRLVRPLTGTPR